MRLVGVMPQKSQNSGLPRVAQGEARASTRSAETLKATHETQGSGTGSLMELVVSRIERDASFETCSEE